MLRESSGSQDSSPFFRPPDKVPITRPVLLRIIWVSLLVVIAKDRNELKCISVGLLGYSFI